ncbi:unnamed protein product, partial [Amoebophrya sp. A25]|eukprot:GSA25T00020397001.1
MMRASRASAKQLHGTVGTLLCRPGAVRRRRARQHQCWMSERRKHCFIFTATNQLKEPSKLQTTMLAEMNFLPGPAAFQISRSAPQCIPSRCYSSEQRARHTSGEWVESSTRLGSPALRDGFMSFDEARRYVRTLDLQSCQEFHCW